MQPFLDVEWSTNLVILRTDPRETGVLGRSPGRLGKRSRVLGSPLVEERIITAAGHQSWQATTVKELTEHLGMVWACTLVGRSRATHHRQPTPKPRMQGPWPKAQHPAELSPAKRAEIRASLNRPEYANLSPPSRHKGWNYRMTRISWLSPRTMPSASPVAG